MLRKNRDSFNSIPQNNYAGAAGLPMDTSYMPSNAYKTISTGKDVTDPFRNMRPNDIPVPGTSVWTNPNERNRLGSVTDMMGLISAIKALNIILSLNIITYFFIILNDCNKSYKKKTDY